jgi:cytochrome c peroxidase
MNNLFLLILAAGLPLAPVASAETATDFQSRYQAEVRQSDPNFEGSPQRGRQFFQRVGVKDWSCSACHTENPAAVGKHAVTAKPIDPLAPAANGQRFTRADKVEKWFKRNCNDVLGRSCSTQEKSDVLAYLIAVKP